jgi:hypothetical protein
MPGGLFYYPLLSSLKINVLLVCLQAVPGTLTNPTGNSFNNYCLNTVAGVPRPAD